MKIKEAFREFEFDKQIAGNTKKTLQTYNMVIRRMFIERYLTNIELEDLNILVVKNYIAELRGREELSISTVNSYVRHVKVFLDWLYVKKYIEIDYRRELPKMRGYKSKKEIYQDDEILLMFQGIHGDSPFEWKARAVFALLLDTGMRQSEVCGLMLEDIDMDLNYIVIRNTKGRQDRRVPISIQTKRLIFKYIQKRNWDKPYLFVNDGGEQSQARNIRYIVDKYVKGQGIRRGNTHLFRHTYATRKLMETDNIYYVQQVLGHSDITVTRTYLHDAQSYKVLNIKFRSISELIGAIYI